MRRYFWLILAAILFAASCDGSTDLESTAVTGVYRLRSADGSALPALISRSDSMTVEVTGGTLTLTTARTFSSQVDFRITKNGRTTESNIPRTGTYNPFSDRVVLVNSDRTQAVATRAGRQLTITDSGILLVFER